MKNYTIKRKTKDGWSGYIYEDEKGRKHRLDGPAVDHCYYTAGTQHYYIEGIQFTKEDFHKHPEVVAYMNEMKMRKLLGVE